MMPTATMSSISVNPPSERMRDRSRRRNAFVRLPIPFLPVGFRLGGTVGGPLPGAREGRKGDRDQDPDDQHHDHQLDQGESGFTRGGVGPARASSRRPGQLLASPRSSHWFAFPLSVFGVRTGGG